MGLIDKIKISQENSQSSFENLEIDFILTKLRDASYKGTEFEMFYKVWTKLINLKK
jgi:hypothetical protein